MIFIVQAGLLAVPQLVACSGSAVATLLAVPIPDISKSIPTVYGDVFYGNLHGGPLHLKFKLMIPIPPSSVRQDTNFF